MKRNTRIYLLVISSAALLLYYMAFVRKPDAGTKKITIEVRHLDGSCKTLEATTTADSLRELLDDQKLVAGKETEYGLIVTTVDGVAADVSKGESWVITKKGIPIISSIDTTALLDGDKYVIVHISG